MALSRCLGETAEFRAVAAATNAPGLVRSSSEFDGVAADPEPERAKRRALWEAHERIAICHWWQGDIPARTLPDTWVSETGLALTLRRLRQGAYLLRRSAFWRLDYDADIAVVICKSETRQGQEPILGFGAATSVADAARHACREMLLMEVNLQGLVGSRAGITDLDVRPVERVIEAYQTHCPRLLDPSDPREPDEPEAAMPDHLGSEPSVNFDDLSIGDGRAVWACRLPDAVYRSRDRGLAGPFMTRPAGSQEEEEDDG
ncbi:hypothetical protein GTA62_19705 [Roseobacter sp. HKCCD9010]|nr:MULTISPECIES: YcaO-like family protein [unclassified Roseobacter]NNV66136.1 hypothetical protein [Roseobacter sp. HKCCD8434]NNV70384.1 hypothetical protein [Roseobacter sp. HKCCD8474]NNV83151.1 hypothetical protein [Roseobacter sp. HKCCD6547]NNV95949.1 hypothetical protein [Roseobacter sp. HKCCD8914]NNW00207.1 hypothetical protein [Roseobacter sp. HKCCD6505]NNW12998.1 hypothetical protein [Roseobacter sp. HKCCD8484]NNW21486.1 hypothetical protein [Roseobacter sp. HKCCD7543]NNW38535.1 hyp